MRAIMVEVPAELLEQRRQRGIDGFDEMWEGVLHMVPPASGKHQRLGGDLYSTFKPLARAHGLVAHYETGLFHATDDYRVPDLMFARPENCTDRGVDDTAELVVEIRSPGDETYDKLDWYAARGVREILVVHPDTRIPELFSGRHGRVVMIQPNDKSELRLEALDAALSTADTPDGPRLLVTGDGGSAEI